MTYPQSVNSVIFNSSINMAKKPCRSLVQNYVSMENTNLQKEDRQYSYHQDMCVTWVQELDDAFDCWYFI